MTRAAQRRWQRVACSTFSAIVVAIAISFGYPAAAEDGRLTWKTAFGAALTWQERRDYGEHRRSNFVPELVGFAYAGPLVRDLHLRLGARLGFSGLSQASSPEAVEISEYDTYATLEAGVVYDWFVVPSFTIGGGGLVRVVDLTTRAPVSSNASDIGGTEARAFGYTQLGLGVPFFAGTFMIEPLVRYEVVQRDDRYHWRFGAEFTVMPF